MKRILIWVFILGISLSAARGQDAATQQQIDQINGRLQDLIDAQAVQAKRITALEKDISDLRDKSGGASANSEDLQKLADQVQELAKKQQADNDLILKELGKLGKVGSTSPTHKPSPNVTTNAATNNPNPGGKESGYDYKVVAGDTILIIAKKYRDQGIKVTAEQILKANPGLNPKDLKVGQKIFIPAPAQ